MDAYVNEDDGGEFEPERPFETTQGPSLSNVPLLECDHGELLRVIIAEGAEAAMETFFEAKDPNMDSALKLKLIGLASSVADNVRKAIATHATHFGGQR